MKLFIAQTIDGYIAGPNDSLDFLEAFGSEDYGYAEFMKTIDSVIIGRGTFDTIYPKHGWTYPEHLSGTVITSRPLPDDVPDNVVGSGDLDAVAANNPNAYVDGGGKVIRQFCQRNLIREARIFTLPILLGDGIRLFPSGEAETQSWSLVDMKKFDNGVVLNHYRII